MNGRFDVGDIQFLPDKNRSFDVVAGFHSLPFAADPLAALREAVRVVKPGGSLFVVIFGREEHNQLGPCWQPSVRCCRPDRTHRVPDRDTALRAIRSAGLTVLAELAHRVIGPDHVHPDRPPH